MQLTKESRSHPLSISGWVRYRIRRRSTDKVSDYSPAVAENAQRRKVRFAEASYRSSFPAGAMSSQPDTRGAMSSGLHWASSSSRLYLRC